MVGDGGGQLAGVFGLVAVHPAPPGDLHSVPAVLPRIHGRPDVQQGELVVGVDRAAVVVVDDVAHLFAAPVDDPVVSVKRQLVPARRPSHKMSINMHQKIHHKTSHILRSISPVDGTVSMVSKIDHDYHTKQDIC